MGVKLYYLVLLLAFICVTLADIDSIGDEAVISEAQNVPDGIFQLSGMCSAANPCANGGACIQNVCKCLKGTSGDLCQTIDDCKGREKCGYVPCLYNVTLKEAYCKCEGSLKFDDSYKTCKECSCGVSYTKSCEFVEGRKRCNCTDHYEDRLGVCTLCSCKGASSTYGCKFDNAGNKKCPCLKGYAQHGDECKECVCGDHGKCSFDQWGYKNCTCDEGYIGYFGKCKECNCGKKGTCGFNFRGEKECSCQSGSKEYEGTCKACKCGLNAKCNFNSYGEVECTCNSGYGMKNGSCTSCNCNPGTKCTFDTSNPYTVKKTCDDCPKGYADDNGNCRVCDCGVKGSNCTYSIGNNRCQCPKGYKEEIKTQGFSDRTCVEIDGCTPNRCPFPSTKCVNQLGGYKCVCEDGYEGPYSSLQIEKQGCTDINECVKNLLPCDDLDAVCVNTPGSYRCHCSYGYIRKASEEKRNLCRMGNQPWRTAAIIIGVFSAVIITGLVIVIVKKLNSGRNCALPTRQPT